MSMDFFLNAIDVESLYEMFVDGKNVYDRTSIHSDFFSSIIQAVQSQSGLIATNAIDAIHVKVDPNEVHKFLLQEEPSHRLKYLGWQSLAVHEPQPFIPSRRDGKELENAKVAYRIVGKRWVDNIATNANTSSGPYLQIFEDQLTNEQFQIILSDYEIGRDYRGTKKLRTFPQKELVPEDYNWK